MKLPVENSEFRALVDCSARLGRDPLTVQGSTGNTSIKLGDTLWIKASGRWLANAREERMFVPVDISAARYAMGQNTDPSLTSAAPLRSSVETAMHCAIPQRVVIHVHSVNSIVWAVRRDAQNHLIGMLDGIPWMWIPYVASGLPLARAIENAVFANPHARAFILGNHGVVTAGPDCVSALSLLAAIEKRLALPSRFAAGTAPEEPERLAEWLTTDPASRQILSGGFLYPCHALYLGRFGTCFEQRGDRFPSVQREPETIAALRGLAEVISRIPYASTIRYLSPAELAELTAANVYRVPAESSQGTARQIA